MVTTIDLESVLKEIKIVSKQYNDLVDERIKNIENQTEEETKIFITEENRLCDLSNSLKESIGIRPNEGVGALCSECLEIFGNQDRSFAYCYMHSGLEPVIFKDKSW